MNKFTLMGLSAKNNDYSQDIRTFRKNYSLNTGNLLFTYAVESLLNLTAQNLPWNASFTRVNNNKNIFGIVIPMANQLGGHVDLGENGPQIEGVKKPIIAMGLGAQFKLDSNDITEIPDGTKRWLDTFTQNGKKKNISVRGDFTATILDKLGFSDSYEVLGCPSLLINKKKNLGELLWKKYKSSGRAAKVSSLAIAAGNPFKANFASVEKFFINLVDEYQSEYIIQNPELLIKLSLGFDLSVVDKKHLELLKKRWFTDKNEDYIVEWFAKKTTVYTSVSQWFIDQSKKEFVVGTRVHGVQAAIQAGTPAVCVYIDSRTKELCQTMNIPCISAEEFSKDLSMDKVFDAFEQWDYKAFDTNRSIIAQKTLKFLKSHDVQVSNHINSLI